MAYKRADFSILRHTGYGIGFHWTTWTYPHHGTPVSFPDAVEAFDVKAFVEQAVECGAGHVLFTANHALHWLPGPNPEVDRILPGRTCKRDLLMELADGLAAAGIKLIVYYNHGAGGPEQDPEWQEAVGSLGSDQSRFYDNYCRIIRWMGEHYGTKTIAYWFDGGWVLPERGHVPWAEMTEAAKAGNPQRLVCYNPGFLKLDRLTEMQDYWAGEIPGLDFEPSGNLTPTGLPWYSFTALHRNHKNPQWGEWGIDEEVRNLNLTPPDVEDVMVYLKRFQDCGGTVTFNILCYQDGSAYGPDLKVMKELNKALSKNGDIQKGRN